MMQLLRCRFINNGIREKFWCRSSRTRIVENDNNIRKRRLGKTLDAFNYSLYVFATKNSLFDETVNGKNCMSLSLRNDSLPFIPILSLCVCSSFKASPRHLRLGLPIFLQLSGCKKANFLQG